MGVIGATATVRTLTSTGAESGCYITFFASQAAH